MGATTSPDFVPSDEEDGERSVKRMKLLLPEVSGADSSSSTELGICNVPECLLPIRDVWDKQEEEEQQQRQQQQQRLQQQRLQLQQQQQRQQRLRAQRRKRWNKAKLWLRKHAIVSS